MRKGNLPSLKLKRIDIDIAPENRPKSKRTFHLATSDFQGVLLLVSGRVIVVPSFIHMENTVGWRCQ